MFGDYFVPIFSNIFGLLLLLYCWVFFSFFVCLVFLLFCFLFFVLFFLFTIAEGLNIFEVLSLTNGDVENDYIVEKTCCSLAEKKKSSRVLFSCITTDLLLIL